MSESSTSDYSSFESNSSKTNGTQTVILQELYGPLTKVVTDTILKLVINNRNRGETKQVSFWAAEQVLRMVKHAASFTAVQIIKEDEAKRRKEREVAKKAQLKIEIKEFVENRQKSGLESTKPSLRDYGTSIIQYPWEKKEKRGNGAFGEVYRATDKNGFDFAVKVVGRDGIQASCLDDEIKCLMKLSHENIVICYGCAEGKENIYMYLELMKCSVKDEIKRRNGPLKLEEAERYTKDILKGLIYLHGQNFIHRDIKCANILLDNDNNAKLADMGLAKTHVHTTLATYDAVAGTMLYLSPEILRDHAAAGKRSDIWSVGCTVYEMLKTGPPFHDKGQWFFLTTINSNDYAHLELIKDDETFAGSLESFLLKIFVKLEERPYAEKIAQHKWLNDW